MVDMFVKGFTHGAYVMGVLAGVGVGAAVLAAGIILVVFIVYKIIGEDDDE